MVLRLARLPFVALRRLLIAVSVLVLALSAGLLGVFVFWDDIAEELTTGRRPTQFRGELQAELLDDYAGVFGVGHNSGGTVAATLQARHAGTDVIEIDVASLDGELVSAHFPPLPLVGRRVFRGPTLRDVWTAAAVEVIKLDLKETSSPFRRLVCSFLAANGDGRQVIVASRDAETLDALEACAPASFTFLSVSTGQHVDRLLADPDLAARLDGVTIRETLIDPDRASRLASAGLYAIAWTVNDLTRVNELVRLGVDGITTDNLAIMALLGGQERGERLLARPRSTTEASPQPADDDAEAGRQEQRPGQAHPLIPHDQADLDDLEVLGHEQRKERRSHRRDDQLDGAPSTLGLRSPALHARRPPTPPSRRPPRDHSARDHHRQRRRRPGPGLAA